MSWWLSVSACLFVGLERLKGLIPDKLIHANILNPKSRLTDINLCICLVELVSCLVSLPGFSYACFFLKSLYFGAQTKKTDDHNHQNHQDRGHYRYEERLTGAESIRTDRLETANVVKIASLAPFNLARNAPSWDRTDRFRRRAEACITAEL